MELRGPGGQRQRCLADHHPTPQDIDALVGQADHHAHRPHRRQRIVPAIARTAILGHRQRQAVGGHRRQHPRIHQGGRRGTGIAHHHRVAGACDPVNLGRERMRQAHAAVRGRIARQGAAVQGDAIPGQALHVGHRRIVVEIGLVVLVLLQDGEHAGRGVLARLARTDGGNADGNAVAVHIGQLLVQAHHQHHRPVRGDFRMPEELSGLERQRPGRGRIFGGDRSGHGQRCQQQQPGHPPQQARGLHGRSGRRHGDGVLGVWGAAIGGGCQSYALARAP